MDVTHLTSDDWDLFQQRFPDAAAFLAARNVKNEQRRLAATRAPTMWERNRLRELNKILGELP